MIGVEAASAAFDNGHREHCRYFFALDLFFAANLQREWKIKIGDNGSTDTAPNIASSLVQERPRVAALHSAEAGRGRALRRAWLASNADVLLCMDIDFSSDRDTTPALWPPSPRGTVKGAGAMTTWSEDSIVLASTTRRAFAWSAF